MLNQTVLKGAIGGLTENQYLLGQKYYYGNGEDRNIELATSWYELAAKKGHASASFMYAYILLSGENGKINVKKGTKYLKRACHKNHSQSILLLARNYYYGYGVKPSYKKAYKLWKRGTKMGCPEAEYYLGLCYMKGIHVSKNVLKAKKHLYNALDNGFDLAKITIKDLPRVA